MRRIALSLLLAGASACTARTSDPCALQEVAIAATFLGDAFAQGTITVERTPGGDLIGRARLVRMEGQAAEGPGLDLSGPALCRDGIVKVELGAGRTADGRLSVLGGEVHVVLPRAGLVDRAFGEWSAQLRQEDWSAPRTMGGPWVVSTATRALALR